jgi:hypothetical protein
MSGHRLEEEQTIASKTLLTDSAAAPMDRQTPPGGEDVKLSIRTRKPGGDAENENSEETDVRDFTSSAQSPRQFRPTSDVM